MEVKGHIYAILNKETFSTFNTKKDNYILGDLNKNISKSKIIEALKMVNLSEEYLLLKSNDLSNVEYNKLLLVKDLLNKSKIIFLDYFEKGMCYKEREYFKKLFKKLSRNYGLTFLVKTNDFSFCIDLVEEYHEYDGDKLIKVTSMENMYREKIYEKYNHHQLVDFVVCSRKYNHLNDDYYEVNEILKAIYREIR